MECTIFKLALAPAPLVCQLPHSAHPAAFPEHMHPVEKVYMDLYEPYMSNPYSILHV